MSSLSRFLLLMNLNVRCCLNIPKATGYLIIAIVSLNYAASAQSKFHFNGNIEIFDMYGKPVGWSMSTSTEMYPIKVDDSIKQEGGHALSITHAAGPADFGNVGYVILNRFEGKEIELRGYMKTEKVAKGYAGLWMRIDGPDGMLAIENMSKQSITGTTDWTEYVLKLPYDCKRRSN